MFDEVQVPDTMSTRDGVLLEEGALSEMTPVASRRLMFENQKEKDEEDKHQRRLVKTPPRLSKSHIVS